MATNQLSLLRQWHMLRLLPRAPGRMAVRELCERLRDMDFTVTERTIQRDLVELSEVFPLVVDDRNKPFGWSWQKDAASFDLPSLSLPEALTMTLVEQHLGNHLPPNTVAALQPHFLAAARVLSTPAGAQQSQAWLNKVRSILPQQPLLPPALDPACQQTVYLALLHDRQLTLHYKKRDAPVATVYAVVHPLAIVERGGLIYLVCMFADYEDVRTIALHRVHQAEMRYEDARKKPGFDLDAYIATGQFGVIAGAPIVLRATFSRAAGEHLFETPLCADQALATSADGRLALTASVPNTRALVWWLLGFGDGVEVQGPLELREEMAAIAARMAAAYA